MVPIVFFWFKFQARSSVCQYALLQKFTLPRLIRELFGLSTGHQRCCESETSRYWFPHSCLNVSRSLFINRAWYACRFWTSRCRQSQTVKVFCTQSARFQSAWNSRRVVQRMYETTFCIHINDLTALLAFFPRPERPITLTYDSPMHSNCNKHMQILRQRFSLK